MSPVIITTPDEVAAMPWPSRRKALARVRHIVNQMQDVDMPTERLWADSDPDWAEVTRREARRLLAAMPEDPRAGEHRVGVTNDAMAEAMYAQYLKGLSIAQVAEQWQRTRQTVHKMFARRGWEMRPTYAQRRDVVTYNGENYTPANVGYYRATTGDRHYLHRRVYEDAHGPIPADWDVHHIDHDKTNNGVDNLMALSKDEHARLHAGESS